MLDRINVYQESLTVHSSTTVGEVRSEACGLQTRVAELDGDGNNHKDDHFKLYYLTELFTDFKMT